MTNIYDSTSLPGDLIRRTDGIFIVISRLNDRMVRLEPWDDQAMRPLVRQVNREIPFVVRPE